MLELPERISGPVSISHFRTDNDTSILILGDVHFSLKGTCAPCNSHNNCMRLENFIDHALQNKSTLADFVGNIAYKYHNCLVADKSKACKKMMANNRMHYTDVRSYEFYSNPFTIIRRIARNYCDALEIYKKNNYNILAFAEFLSKYDKYFTNNIIANYIAIVFTSRQKLLKYIAIIYESDTPDKDIIAIIGKKLFDEIHDMSFYEKGKISKIRKQAIKVPDYTMQIFDFYEEKLKKFATNFDFSKVADYVKLFTIEKQIEFLHSISSTPSKIEAYMTKIINLLESIEIFCLDIGVSLMDIYTNSRMIYYSLFYKSNIIVFIGDEHANNYRDFFKKINFGKEIKNVRAKKTKSNDNTTSYVDTYNRCIETS
jgi:hypothetical protein